MTVGKESGFTLLETIVALMVLAMVVAGLQLCLSTGWHGIRLVNQEQAALQIARSQLASLGTDTGLAAGVEEGETADGFVWTREIRSYVTPESDPAASSGVSGYWVDVTVRWREGPRRQERHVTLSTFKLGSDG